jgi:hypothetical protein
MALGLEVLGHLTIQSDDGKPLRLECRGDVLVCDLPDLRTALALGRTMSRAWRRAWLRRFRTGLARAGLALEFRIAGRRVGRLAADSASGRFASLLGLDPMEIHLHPLLGALFPRTRQPGSSGSPHPGDAWTARSAPGSSDDLNSRGPT